MKNNKENMFKIPSIDIRHLRMQSHACIWTSQVLNRLTVISLMLAVFACVGFFVITLLGYKHEEWMLAASFALVFGAMVFKVSECIYWNKYRTLRDHLSADVIQWLSELKQIKKDS